MRFTFSRQAVRFPGQILAESVPRLRAAAFVLAAVACLRATAVAHGTSSAGAGVPEPESRVATEASSCVNPGTPETVPCRATARPLGEGLERDSVWMSVSSPDASSRVVSYVFPSEQDTLSLPDRNVFVGSESVSVGTTLLSRSEYFLDCENGLVCLKRPARPAELIEVKYRFLPFYVRSSHSLRDERVASSPANGDYGGRTAAAVTPGSGKSLLPARGGLKLRGTKTFSLELGSNREASLKQSLDMNVTGEISKGLELNAILTDRDLPIQPEGRTESVRELDEIRVEMRSRAFSASLGDCEMVLEGASLVNVSRKLEGARATGNLKGVELTAAGSTLRGRWTSREFAGVEGKQGPYQLLTDAGAACVVIAGTERVWLDGVKLRRGEGADYWMDYGTGKVYFTNTRAVHGESRIRVEYEYSYGDYQKNFYALKAGRSFGGGLARLEFLTVSEADDRSLGAGSLSEEEKSLLRELGDASSVRTVEGARYVGPGNGDYNFVSLDSLGVSIYEYSSDGNGAYDVGFVNVGQGRGSYLASADAAGKTFFAYVGPNGAEYVPARAMTAPASRRVGDVRTVFSLRGVEVAGELAVSQADLNTFSPRDDDDNRGTAGLVTVKTAPARLSLTGRSLGRLSLAGNLRSTDDDFLTFGNLNRAFDAERWAVGDSAVTGRGERRLELETTYYPVEILSFSFGHGRLASSSGLSANRFAYGSELTGRLSLSARLERASSTNGYAAAGSAGSAGSSLSEAGSSRTVKSVTSRLNGFRMVPAASYYSEVREQAGGSGLMIQEAGAGLSSAWRAPVSVRIDEKYRVEYLGTPDERTRSYDALTHTVGVQLNKWKSLSAACEYSLRNLHGYLGAGTSRHELGRLSVSQSARSGRLSYEVNHHVTSLDADQSAKSIVYVGQNQGHYDSTGTYRGRGDYEVNITKLETSLLSSDAATSATLTLRPFKGLETKGRAGGRHPEEGKAEAGPPDGGQSESRQPEVGRPQTAERQSSVAGILETLTSSSLFRSTGVLREAEGVFALLASPMYTERPSALRGSSLFREELEMAAPSRRVALRYLFELSSLLNNQYENVRERNEERKSAVRVRSEPFQTLTLELEQVWRTRSRHVEVYQGASAQGNLRGTESTLDVRFLPVRNVELELYGSLSGLRDEDAGRGLTVYKISPSATYGVRTSTRARLVFTLSSYDGEAAVLSTAAPAVFVEPYRMEVFFSLDHRAGEHLTFSTSVSSRRSTGDFVTDGRVEMRAHF